MALLVKVGTYTGDASDPKTISGVGFTPKVVIIGATAGTGDPSSALFKTSDMPTGSSGITSNMGENGQNSGGEIDTLNSDGFTVRGQKNLSGTVYYYLALAGTDVYTGTYTGNATDNRNITGVGFFPKWVVIQGGSNHTVHKSTATGNTTDTAQYFTTVANLSDAIQNLNSDGFQVGTANQTNANGTTYYYFALTGDNFNSGTYTGNGSDDRNITGVGFNPEFVLIKDSSTKQAVLRSGHSGDLSSYVRANLSPSSNLIQSLGSEQFQVGTGAEVNSNGAIYYWISAHSVATTNTTNFFQLF